MVSLDPACTKMKTDFHTPSQSCFIFAQYSNDFHSILTSGSSSHIKHGWFQHRVMSQKVQHSFLTAPTVWMNQQSIKPCHIHTTVCCSAVDHCESSVITAQNYPTTRSQLVAIAVPGQGSEEVTETDIVVSVQVVLDIDICDPYFQCYVLTWYTSACINVEKIYK